MRTYLIVPDMHIPFHCIRFTRLITKILKEIKFTGVVQLGDALDFFQVSKYAKDPERKNSMSEDILTYRQIVCEWSEHVDEFHQLEGNHEHRLIKFVWTQAKELQHLVKPISEMIRPEKVIFKYYPLSDWKACIIGDCVLHHGWFFNQHTAMNNLGKYPKKIITGHTHRFQYVSDGSKFSVTLGHASNEDETMHNPIPSNWQQAFGILTVIQGVTYFEPVLVTDGKAWVRGKLVKA